MYKVGHIFGISVFYFLQPVIEKAYLLTFDAGIDKSDRSQPKNVSATLTYSVEYILAICRLCVLSDSTIYSLSCWSATVNKKFIVMDT